MTEPTPPSEQATGHKTYVRFATHYGFRPDFWEGHDPESKGIVEHLVGYADLVDNSVGRVITNLLRNDLILVDELGLRSAG